MQLFSTAGSCRELKKKLDKRECFHYENVKVLGAFETPSELSNKLRMTAGTETDPYFLET